MEKIKIGILTNSFRASPPVYENISEKLLMDMLTG